MEEEIARGELATEKTAQKRIELSLWPFGLATFGVILVVSFLLWYLLVDPQTAVISVYPQPFGCWLFWNILTLVWFAFNFELWCLRRLSQPVLGLVAFIVSFILAFVVIWVVNYGLGSLDPAFAPGRPGGIGFLTSAMFVLLGFYFYGAFVAQWQHWPWVDGGLKQPLVGVAEFLLGTVLGLAGYLVLCYPNLAVWAGQGGKVVDLNTALGWFYSVIVLYIMTITITENWPYRLCKTRAGVAISSVVGNFLLGTVFYYFALWLLKNFLVPAEVQAVLGDAITAWPAELGVCFVLWLLFWANAFGNYPTHFSHGANMLVRFIITFSLGVFSFAVYYNFGLAVKVLHEPVIAGKFGGDALLWMDWVIFWLFAYAFNFNFWPFRRKA